MIAFAALAAPMPAPDIVIVRGERLGERSPNAQRLNGEQLQNQSGVRLDEALREVPGVGLFRRTSSGAANATIQGLSLRPIAPNGAGRALVSLDGVPQNDPFGGWIYWSRYDPLFLERIDVARGGAGAGFGPLALTGTLDLTEARGRPARLNASIGSQNSIHVAGRTSALSSAANFTAMGAFESSDGSIPVRASQRGFADRAVDFQALSLTLVTDLARDNGAWSFRGSGFSEAKGAGLVGGQSAASGLDVSAARRFKGEWGQSRVLVYAQGRAFSNRAVAVTAGRAGTTPTLDQFATPSSAIGGSIEFAPDMPLGQRFAMPKVTLDWRRAVGQTREFFRYIGNDFTRTRTAGGTQDLLGAGLSLSRPRVLVGTGLHLDGGVRVDYWSHQAGVRIEADRVSGTLILNEQPKDKNGTVLTGRLSFAQVKGPFALSLYRTFRPPSLNELHRPFRVGSEVTEANAALVPETLLGIDFDFQASRPLANGTLTTSLTAYINRLDDPIANVTTAMGPAVLPRVGFLPAGGSLRERQNVGRIDATGLEARLGWRGGLQTLSWYVAASVTDAQVNGGIIQSQLTGKRPAQAPRWSGVAGLVLPLSQRLQLSALARGESARFEDDLNTRKLAAYGALDLRAIWQVKDTLQVYFAGENVLDAPISTALAGDGVESRAPRRMVRLGVKIGR